MKSARVNFFHAGKLMGLVEFVNLNC